MPDRYARSRMGHLVFLYMQRHPLLQPLREAGERVYLSHHFEAIWASALPSSDQPGTYEIEVRIKHPRWWAPVLDTEEDWAAKLTTRLAKGIRKGWKERGG